MAFPKTQSGTDPMLEAPSPPEPTQYAELGLRFVGIPERRAGLTALGPPAAVGRFPRSAALLGAFCIAFSGIFYRWSGVSPATGVVFRCLYGLPLLALAAWFEQRERGRMSPRTIWLSGLAGLFFAADLLTFHYVVDNMGAGLATVMGNLQVVVVASSPGSSGGAPAPRGPRRPPDHAVRRRPDLGRLGGGAYGQNAPLGVAIGLITACAYAGYLLVIRRASPDARPAGPVTIATTTCMVAAGVFGSAVHDLDLSLTWPAQAYLLAYGVTSQSIGYLLIQVSLPRLPAVLTSAILLAQPVMTVVFAIILLGEAPSAARSAASCWWWSDWPSRRARSRGSATASVPRRSRRLTVVSARARPGGQAAASSASAPPETCSSRSTLAATSRACCSARSIAAGGSFGWPVYQPICSWLPPSMTVVVTFGPSLARFAGSENEVLPPSSEP